MMEDTCRHCYGTGVTYWPVGGDLLQARVCSHCGGKRTT